MIKIDYEKKSRFKILSAGKINLSKKNHDKPQHIGSETWLKISILLLFFQPVPLKTHYKQHPTASKPSQACSSFSLLSRIAWSAAMQASIIS